jgi:hypothetical protein
VLAGDADAALGGDDAVKPGGVLLGIGIASARPIAGWASSASSCELLVLPDKDPWLTETLHGPFVTHETATCTETALLSCCALHKYVPARRHSKVIQTKALPEHIGSA